MNNSTGKEIYSHKEEILLISRKSGKDEGVEYAKLKGNKLGEYSMAVVVIPIMAFTVIFGELVALFAVTATILGFAVGQCFTKYRFTKRKSHLAWTVGITIVTILCVVFLVARSLEWWL